MPKSVELPVAATSHMSPKALAHLPPHVVVPNVVHVAPLTYDYVATDKADYFVFDMSEHYQLIASISGFDSSEDHIVLENMPLYTGQYEGIGAGWIISNADGPDAGTTVSIKDAPTFEGMRIDASATYKWTYQASTQIVLLGVHDRVDVAAQNLIVTSGDFLV